MSPINSQTTYQLTTFFPLFYNSWYEISCLFLEDPVLGIKLETFTQTTNVPSECVNQLRFETPNDYNYKNTGFAIPLHHVMCEKLKTSKTEWHQAWSGISRKELLYLAACSLAHLYKNRVRR